MSAAAPRPLTPGLDVELLRVRLLLRRRLLWLRASAPVEPDIERLLAGSEDGEEQRFYATDSRAAAITATLAELERRRSYAPLAAVSTAFQLNAFERDVLMLCLATEVEPAIERLFALAQEETGRSLVNPNLAAILLCEPGPPRWYARAAFAESSPLRRYRLVHQEGRTGLAVRLEDRVAAFLLGDDAIDPRVSDVLRRVQRVPLSSAAQALTARVAEQIRRGIAAGSWPALVLSGPPDAGASAIAAEVCARFGIELLEWRPEGSASPSDRHEFTALLAREALLGRFAVYVDATRFEDAGAAPLREAALHVIEALPAFVVVATTAGMRLSREHIPSELSAVDEVGRRELWQQALGPRALSLNGEVDRLVEQFSFGPETVASIARDASHAPADTPEDAVWNACRSVATARLNELAQRLVPVHTWDDIVLPDDTMRQLREIAAQVANRAHVYQAWGFGAKLVRGRGISALFSGPSGTGKTMAAEILAGDLRLDLFRIDLASIVSKYIGETEKNLRRVFDAAEESGAVLFFDEADALFGKRSEVKDSHDRYANIEVNYLLQRMEDYRGLAILATNMKSQLDQAFLRRLRFLVDFPFPDARHRQLIWRGVFPKQAALGELEYGALARLDVPGGNIRNIAVNAAFNAASENAAIEMRHIMAAARREYQKIDKLASRSEFGAYLEAV